MFEQLENKKNYTEGSRVKLLIKDTISPLTAGEEGTVLEVDSNGMCHILWDCGFMLGFDASPDVICNIPQLTNNIKFQIEDIEKKYSIDFSDCEYVQEIAENEKFTELVYFIKHNQREYLLYIRKHYK